MTFGFIQDVPADEQMYDQIKALLPEHPEGLIAHIVTRQEAGLRYLDVWESEAQWERFRVDHVEPAVDQVLAAYGIPRTDDQVHLELIDVVDAWLGTAASPV